MQLEATKISLSPCIVEDMVKTLIKRAELLWHLFIVCSMCCPKAYKQFFKLFGFVPEPPQKHKGNHSKKRRRNNNRSKATNKGKPLVRLIMQTINHFFPDLLQRIREKVEDPRKKASQYKLSELVMACIAMSMFKEGSRNALNESRKEGYFKKNYFDLFKQRLPHMDTVDRVMKQIQEHELEQLKKSFIQTLLDQKVLHKFRFFGRDFTVSVDATGVHTFDEKPDDDQCIKKVGKRGKITYYRNVLEAKLVGLNGFCLSLATEWIENTDDGNYDKQDCELNAFKRLAVKLKSFFPRLPICILADGLYPSEPFFKICQNNNWRFIATLKDKTLMTVQSQVEALLEKINDENKGKTKKENQRYEKYYLPGGRWISREYSWLEKITYRGRELYWVHCLETTQNKLHSDEYTQYRFVYISDVPVDSENIDIWVQIARSRHKIENEGFNCQKNLGYELQHKFSRTNLTATKNYYQCMQIAHIFNQLLELSQHMKSQLYEWKTTLKHCWKCIWGYMVHATDVEALAKSLTQRVQYRY